MTYSEITITFNADLEINQRIEFNLNYSYLPNADLVIQENWVNFRTAIRQVTKGSPTTTAGERSAINFVTSFELDYNGSNNYEVSRISNVVTIKSFNPQVLFSNFICIDNFNEFPLTLTNDASAVINNYTGDIFQITDIEILEATNPCTHYKVSVTTNGLATRILFEFGNIIENNTENPFSFEVLRGQPYFFTVENSNGESIFSGLTSNYPNILNPNDFSVQINNSINGSTAIVQIASFVSVNNYEYSLDNSTWQSSNVFNGLGADEYTLYIRDNLGCSTSLNFIIDETGYARVPYFLLPKANSIRFANRITWGDCANYKTDENALSCEANVPLPYKQIQLFQSCDIITTQFRSNYTNISATVIEADGTETSIPVVQVSNYMGKKDKRDARKYNLSDGKTGVYFTSGNTYDYDTSVNNGDYILNGLLPEWAIIGNYFDLDGSSFLIEDIIFDETKNTDVLVISNNYIGIDVVVIVSSIYNRENYEEYEFTIDMVNFMFKKIQVRINNNDDTFTDLVHLSEVIDVKVKHINTLEIKYKNSVNTDINYSRGLEHTIRLLIEKISVKPDDESEPHKTDSSAVLLNSEVHQLKEFLFQPVTTQMMWLIVLALSQDTVTIDGENYIKNSNIAVEGPLEETNLYEITATMLSTGNVFNSDTGQGNSIFAGENLEIPGLVDYGGGFVKY